MSFCIRAGTLPWFPPRNAFSGEENGGPPLGCRGFNGSP